LGVACSPSASGHYISFKLQRQYLFAQSAPENAEFISST
jgi:hypothetical protein